MGKRKEKVRKEGYIGTGKFWAWQSRELSDAAFNFLVGWIMFYCTDVMLVSPLLIGVLFAISKGIDAVTDIIAGYIVDNTNTKLGRGRPWDLCLIGAWGSMVLLFSCPESFSEGARLAWIVFWYIMANAVFYTFLNAGENVFRLRAFDQPQMVKLASMGGIATSLMGLLCGIFIPQAVSAAGTDPSSWRMIAIVSGIIFTIIGLARFAFIRERDDLIMEKKQETEKLKIRDIFRMLSKNHQWLLVCAITLIGSIIANMGVMVYYFEKILGDVGVQSYFAAASALAVFALVILPKLMKKFRLQQILMAGQFIAAVVLVISFIFYDNIPILIICYVINMFATVPGTYAISLIMYDNAIYNQYLGMHRMEGTLGSVNGFIKRAGSALGSFFLGVGLTLIQYDATAVTLEPITFWGLRFMMYGLPAISSILQTILWSRYTLEKNLPKMKEEILAREQKEESEV